ncbi:conserved hypothetical protein [Mycolicibacter sinensis]|uniref:Uncharacterized protein n=1 Tax=Mycolicibacter sinensis (strain JDM601) TaxID=875328 RepID=F5Z3W0_MYCSD|nr:conserved hypothetical protein [Mycolicibacter sinensis]
MSVVPRGTRRPQVSRTGQRRPPAGEQVAAPPIDAIGCQAVMSASAKPRLAGRQPSNRGGVPRVIDRVE